MADDFYRQNFNTQLTPQEEADFKLWLVDQSTKRKRDMSQEDANYDIRGYWKAGSGLDNAQGHLPDAFKKPNHPTFSSESQYNGAPNGVGGQYVGGEWKQSGKRWAYTPSPQMLKSTHNPAMLQQYFQKYEPDATLVMPR